MLWKFKDKMHMYYAEEIILILWLLLVLNNYVTNILETRYNVSKWRVNRS